MNCKSFRNRHKNRNLYFFCVKKKKEITYDDCKYCNDKEYKQYNILKSRSNKLAKKEKERFSVFTNDMEHCYLCNSTYQITKHEIFEGRNRKNSIIYGFVLPLCLNCHIKITNDNEFLLGWKCKAQQYYINNISSLDDFIRIFGKNYIYIASKK